MSKDIYFEYELLNRLKDGDELAFKEIYNNYWKFLFNLAVQKVKTTEIAEEIVQNIFIDLWENRETRNINNIKAYLSGAVRYGVINYIKNQLVQEKYKEYTAQKETGFETIESVYHLKELNSRIEIGISTLPLKTQSIFRLSRFELLSNKEIAKNFNISEKAVEYHITQSLKSLKRFLKDYALTISYFFTLFFRD